MKRHYSPFVGWLLLLACGSGSTHELAVDFILGSDSNPNQLADAFEVDAEPYVLGRVRFSHEPENSGFYYALDGRSDRYNRDEKAVTNAANAEETHLRAVGGFNWVPVLDHGPARFTADLFYQRRDAVFVNRATGDVARSVSSTGEVELIPDRFDADSAGLRMSADFPLSRESDFIFALQAYQRQYESYLDIGLNNLDYNQAEIDLGFEKQMGPRTRVRTAIGGGTREYHDRRARAEDGALLPETDLEFSLLEVVGEMDVQLSRRWSWQLGADIDQRQDNASGYYDLTEGRIFTEFRYRNRHYVDFSFNLAYMNRHFDNIEDNVIITLEEEEKETDGYRVRTELVRNIADWLSYDVDLIFGLNYQSIGHDDFFYNHDRGQFYIGVRWHAY